MLQTIRERIQGWIAWTLVIIITITFTVWGISSYFYGSSARRPKAIVNGAKISNIAFDHAYEQLRKQRSLSTEDPSALNVAQLKKEALQDLIQREALYQHAHDMGVLVSEQTTQAVLVSLPPFLEDGKFSTNRFHQVLNMMRYTPKEFVKMLNRDLTTNQVQAAIVGSAFTLPQELRNDIALIDQKRDFTTLKLSSNRFKAEPSERAVKQFYEKNKQRFMAPMRIQVKYVELKLADLNKNYKADNKAIEEYYDTHKSNYRTSPQWRLAHIVLAVPDNADEKAVKAIEAKARDIVAQYRKGTSFAKLAKKHSSDVLTADKGGVIKQWLTFGSIDNRIMRKVNDTKVNQVVGPIRTRYGFTIVKVLGHKPSVTLPLANVREQIKAVLKQQYGQKAFAEKNDQLADLAFTNPDSLDAVAKEVGLVIKTSPHLTLNGEDKGTFASKKIMMNVFSSELREEPYVNSDVIQVAPGHLVVLRINKVEPAKVKPLSVVRKAIVKELTLAHKHAQAAIEGRKILDEINSGKPLASVAKAHKLKLETYKRVKRSDGKVDDSIRYQVFALPPHKLATTGFSLPNGDYIIVRLNDLEEGDINTLPKAAAAELEQKSSLLRGQLDYAAYLKTVMDGTRIKITK